MWYTISALYRKMVIVIVNMIFRTRLIRQTKIDRWLRSLHASCATLLGRLLVKDIAVLHLYDAA